MVVNPDKFQVINIDKHKADHKNVEMSIDNEIVKALNTVKLLVVCIDQKLNFNEHIGNICESAGNQLESLQKLKHFLTFDQKKLLVNSYVFSNFNYCALVGNFCHSKCLNKLKITYEGNKVSI